MNVADERAKAQALAKERRSANAAALEEYFAEHPTGRWIVLTSWASTGVFVLTTVVATVVNNREARLVAALLSLALFSISLVLHLVALWLGAQRSRRDEMTMVGWWFLSESAPKSTRAHLWGALLMQIVVSCVCAAIRFETSIAFGVLVPMLGLSFLGLWGAMYGMFAPRRASTGGSVR